MKDAPYSPSSLDTSAGCLTIRAYGDSMLMPRFYSGLRPEETYFELLVDALELSTGRSVRAYNRGRGRMDIGSAFDLYHQDSRYYGIPLADLCVIHVGVVDCAPRPVPERLRLILGRMRGRARARVSTFLHDHRAALVRFGPVWRVTEPGLFDVTMRQWVSRAAHECRLTYVLNIAPMADETALRSPGLEQSIHHYNEMIAAAVRDSGAENVVLIDVHSLVQTSLEGEPLLDATDGYHLTAAGHRAIARLMTVGLQIDSRSVAWSQV